MGKVLAALVLFFPGATTLADSQAPPEGFQISVSVDLVVLYATVHDRKGQVATDLAQRDFTVFEDGVRQSLRLFRHEDTPVTVGLIVDHSGSMRPKLQDVAAAARMFVEASSTQDEMFVVNFNEKATMGLPGSVKFTHRSDLLERAIANAPTAGQTGLYDAIIEGLNRLKEGGPEKKALIVISDGADNASQHTLAEAQRLAQQSSVLVYSIGIFAPDDPDRNPDVLRRLARATGGEAFFPEQPPETRAICQRIAREIRNQYTLGYISENPPRPGAFRSLKVTATTAERDKLSVRTRAGYITAGGPGR